MLGVSIENIEFVSILRTSQFAYILLNGEFALQFGSGIWNGRNIQNMRYEYLSKRPYTIFIF